MKPDLHLHSSCSDGTDTPEELARLAKEAGLDVIALTDHDTTSGVIRCQSACEALGIRFLPGVEISAGGEIEIHVLGYGIRADDMEQALQSQRGSRDTRMVRIVQLLNEAGIPVSMDDIEQAAAGAPLGRPHAALALVRLGYASSVKEAFSRWLGDGRPCCVRREKPSFAAAVDMIHQCGGAAVIAHPALLRTERRMLTQFLSEKLLCGTDGIEVWHSSHTSADCRELESFARRRSLAVTGGSDYHGHVKSVRPGEGTDRWPDPEKDLQLLLSRIRPSMI